MIGTRIHNGRRYIAYIFCNSAHGIVYNAVNNKRLGFSMFCFKDQDEHLGEYYMDTEEVEND